MKRDEVREALANDAPDLLGTDELEPGLADEYAARRQTVAFNMAHTLISKSPEYSKTQSETNGQYLHHLAEHLPTFALNFTTERFTPYTLGKPYGLRFNNMEGRISIDAPSEDISPDVLADMSALRAATVWLRLPRTNNVVTEINGASGDQYVYLEEPPEILLPHVLIGHKSLPDGNIEALFMPFEPRLTRPVWDERYGTKVPPETSKLMDYVCADKEGKDHPYNQTAFIGWQGHLLSAQMDSQQYNRLIVLQEVLFDRGLSTQEVETMYDRTTNELTLSSSLPISLRAHPAASHFEFMHKPPEHVEDLEKHSFALHDMRRLDYAISPADFLEFAVLKETQRLMTMLNQNAAFEAAENELVESTHRNQTE